MGVGNLGEMWLQCDGLNVLPVHLPNFPLKWPKSLIMPQLFAYWGPMRPSFTVFLKVLKAGWAPFSTCRGSALRSLRRASWVCLSPEPMAAPHGVGEGTQLVQHPGQSPQTGGGPTESSVLAVSVPAVSIQSQVLSPMAWVSRAWKAMGNAY